MEKPRRQDSVPRQGTAVVQGLIRSEGGHDIDRAELAKLSEELIR